MSKKVYLINYQGGSSNVRSSNVRSSNVGSSNIRIKKTYKIPESINNFGLNYPKDKKLFKKRLLHDYPDLKNPNNLYLYNKQNYNKDNIVFKTADDIINKLYENIDKKKDIFFALPFNYFIYNIQDDDKLTFLKGIRSSGVPDLYDWNDTNITLGEMTFNKAGIKLFDNSLHKTEEFKVNNYFGKDWRSGKETFTPPKGGISATDLNIWHTSIREFKEETNGVKIELLKERSYGGIDDIVKLNSDKVNLPFFGKIIKIEDIKSRYNDFYTRYYHIRLLNKNFINDCA